MRIKRRVRSTLSAETQAVGAALDTGGFVRVAKNYLPPGGFLQAYVITDARSLYDVLIREGQLSHLAEKRLALDLAGIIDLVQEQIDYEEDADPRDAVLWVPTTHQRRMLSPRFVLLTSSARCSSNAGLPCRASPLL